MQYTVSFTPEAEKDFETILNYIQINFGKDSANRFKKLVWNFTSLMEGFPEVGSMEIRDKNIRGFVIHRRLKVFYRIKGGSVIVLKLFDTRQHPNKKL